MSNLAAIALHEAAHTVICYRLGGALRDYVWACRDEGNAALILPDLNPEADAVTTLAGMLAVQLFREEIIPSATDFEDVKTLANTMPDPHAAVQLWITKTIALLQEREIKEAIFDLAEVLEREGFLHANAVEKLLLPWLESWYPDHPRSDDRIVASITKNVLIDLEKIGIYPKET